MAKNKNSWIRPTTFSNTTTHAGAALHAPVQDADHTKQLVVEIFDPSYFVDFALQKQDPFRLVGAPASCTTTIQRPSDGTAAAQKLGEDTFLNGKNTNYGAMFANRIAVDCP